MSIVLETIMVQTKRTTKYGAWLRDKRLAKNLKQSELAALAARIAGVSITGSYISLLESDKPTRRGGLTTRPDVRIVDAISTVLETDLDEARAMFDLQLLKDEERDRLADEFLFALQGYKQLTDEGKAYLKDMIRRTLHFLLDARKEAVETEKLTKKKTFRWMPTGEKGEDHDPRDLGIEIHDVDDQGNVIKKKR